MYKTLKSFRESDVHSRSDFPLRASKSVLPRLTVVLVLIGSVSTGCSRGPQSKPAGADKVPSATSTADDGGSQDTTSEESHGWQVPLKHGGMSTVSVELEDIADLDGKNKRYLYVGFNSFMFPLIGMKAVQLQSMQTSVGELKVDETQSGADPFTMENNAISNDSTWFRFPVKDGLNSVKISQLRVVIPVIHGTEVGKFEIPDLREAADTGLNNPELERAGLKVTRDASSTDETIVFRISISPGFAMKRLKIQDAPNQVFLRKAEIDFEQTPEGSVAAPQLASFRADAPTFKVVGHYYRDIKIVNEEMTYTKLVAKLEPAP